MEEIHLGANHVTGFRIFRLDMEKMLLLSLTNNQGGIWKPKEIKVSACGHHKVKPEPDCMCGIWSTFSRKSMTKTYNMPFVHANVVRRNVKRNADTFYGFRPRGEMISARIEQWGIVIEHEWGYRSEFARIIPETIQLYPRSNRHHMKKVINHLRQKYGAERKE